MKIVIAICTLILSVELSIIAGELGAIRKMLDKEGEE